MKLFITIREISAYDINMCYSCFLKYRYLEIILTIETITKIARKKNRMSALNAPVTTPEKS